MTTENKYPIPATLNVILVILVTSVMVGLLVLASYVQAWWLLPITVAFAFFALTNYALMHEASHRALHPNERVNDFLGAITGLLFPTSATLMRITHDVHHRCNRTDHEMFDCYYPGDNRLVKWAQWYSILCGAFWLIIPLGAFVVGFLHPVLMTKPFKSSRSASVLYDDFDTPTIRRVQLEALVLLVVWGGAIGYGLLDWRTTLLLFTAAGVNWSTRQYVTHAWSPRRIIDGAHNLSTSRWHQAMLLNGNWDIVHHEHPAIPWIHLPKLGQTSRAPISYLRQWFSLWRGPRPATEPDPRQIPHGELAGPAV